MTARSPRSPTTTGGTTGWLAAALRSRRSLSQIPRRWRTSGADHANGLGRHRLLALWNHRSRWRPNHLYLQRRWSADQSHALQWPLARGLDCACPIVLFNRRHGRSGKRMRTQARPTGAGARKPVDLYAPSRAAFTGMTGLSGSRSRPTSG